VVKNEYYRTHKHIAGCGKSSILPVFPHTTRKLFSN
jgi:hypothetical protein